MNSKSHANKHKLVMFLIPERGQTRLLSFRAIKSGNAKRNACVEEALTNYLDGNNP